MSDRGQTYEEFVRFTDCWVKGGGRLPSPFAPSSFSDLARDELSRLGSPSLRSEDHFGDITKMVGISSAAQRHG